MSKRAPTGIALTLMCGIAAALILTGCGGEKTAYTVSVAFNDRYTDDAGAAVEAAIHDYDAKADVLLQTSFPPVAHATVHTNDAAFCDTLRQRLMSRPEVAIVNCGAE